MTTMWIGPDEELKLGQKGFLVEHSNHNTGRGFYVLRDTPAHTNQSYKPKLHGWCGTSDNIATYGKGAWRVVRVAKNGRALIEELEGGELQEMLEEFGYPELAPVSKFVQFLGDCAINGKRVSVYKEADTYRLRAETIGDKRLRQAYVDEDGNEQWMTIQDKVLTEQEYEDLFSSVEPYSWIAALQRTLEWMGYKGFSSDQED